MEHSVDVQMDVSNNIPANFDVIIQFICKGRVFTANKAFLSSKCEYFYNMFTSNLCEANQSEVEMPDWEPKAMEVLLDYLYTGNFRDVEFKDLGKVLCGLHLVHLPEAYDYYKKAFLNLLSEANFFEVWAIADSLEDRQMLDAVHNLAERIFKADDFKRIPLPWLKQLLEYQNKTEKISNDLKFQIILQWTSAFEFRHSHLSELLEDVDFRKLSNFQLYQIMEDPLFSDSKFLMDRTLSATKDRLLLMAQLDGLNVLSANIFLIGIDKNNKLSIQNCKLGQWMNDFSLSRVVFESIAADINPFSLNVDIIKKDKDGEIMFLKHGSNAIPLGKIPADATMIMERSSDCILVIGYLPTNREFTFITYFSNKGTLLEKLLKLKGPMDMREHRLYLLSSQEKFFMVAVAETNKHRIRILIHEHNVEKKRFVQVASFTLGCGSLVPSIFPQITDSHIVIRFFPGKSYYFCLSDKKFRVKEENNNIPQIVSLRMVKTTAWCVDRRGQVFAQHLNSGDFSWKTVARAPYPLRNYEKIVVYPMENEKCC